MKRLPFVKHLSHDEINARYRACGDGAEKTRWLVIRLLSVPEPAAVAPEPAAVDPKPAVAPEPAATPASVAPTVGLSVDGVRRILKRWNALGAPGLADRRASNGNDPRLKPEQTAKLAAALRAEPPDGGLWSGPKVAAFCKAQFGVEAHPTTGWKWLRKLGFTLQVPRPKHPGSATAEEKRGWESRPQGPCRTPPRREPRQDHRGLEPG